jgi:hypothetical protein
MLLLFIMGYDVLMKQSSMIKWISAVGIIAVLFGLFYGFFGLEGLPVYKKFVANDVFHDWANGLYGSVFIGFGVLVFFTGRHAFQKNDKSLMKSLLYAFNSWLIVEALFSVRYGVYVNVGVDIFLMTAFSYPLIKSIRS